MELFINTSNAKHVDKFRAEKMFNLMQQILDGDLLDLEGSPFIDCANYVRKAQNLDLYLVLLGKDASPLSPTHCIVIDEDETIVFDPQNSMRKEKVRYLTEPVYYRNSTDETRIAKQIAFYIVARRRAGELSEL
jgi:hypothetical protein